MTSNLGIGQVRLISKILDEHFPGVHSFGMQDVLFIIKEMLTDEGKRYLERKENVRGTDIYRQFVRFIFSKNLSNLDTMVLLTAMKGGGKSSTAIQLVREWCRILGWQFSEKKYIAYSNADLMRKIKTLPPFSPLIADESVRFVSSEDWNKKENKELKKLLAQVREKHFFFILCFPLKIKKVDKVYLDSFVNYWMEIYDRGYSAVYVPDKNPVFDAWRLDQFKSIGSYNEFTSISQVEDRLKKHPNFWKFIKIPKVPEPIYNRYKNYREAHVYDNGEPFEAVSKDEIYKSLLLLTLSDIMTMDKTFSMMRIAKHIKTKYNVTINSNDMRALVEDAKRLFNTLQASLNLSDNESVVV